MTGEQMNFFDTPPSSQPMDGSEVADFFGEEKKASEFTLGEISALQAEIVSQRDIVEAVKEKLATENAKLTAMQAKMISFLEESGMKSYPIPGGGSMTVVERLSVRTPKTPEEKAAFFAFLRERGVYDELVSVNSNTLNSFYKQEFDNAKDAGNHIGFKIPGIGEPQYTQVLQIRKGK